MMTAERRHSEIADDAAYSTVEARQRLGGISKQTLRELVRQGRIRVVHAGRRVLVPRSEIIRFLSPDHGDHAA
jgi:excisionase family DNA binding protein